MLGAAINTLVPLLWDSEFLGFPVAAIHTESISPDLLRTLLSESKRLGFELIYLYSQPSQDDVQLVVGPPAGRGFRYVKLVLPVLPTNRQTAILSPFIQLASEPTDRLDELARQSGSYSRFRLDSRFKPEVYTQLYQQWLRRAFRHDEDREVLVYQNVPKSSQGLLTLATQAERTAIDLLAVDQSVRGKGIGRQLVQAAYRRAQQVGHTALEVTTQLDNMAAYQFYLACGFRPESAWHIYHIWLD